jgi:hypothetical protein
VKTFYSLNKKDKGLFRIYQPDIFAMLTRQVSNNALASNGSIQDLSDRENITLLLERWLIFRPEVLILVDPYLKTDEVGCGIVTDYIQKFTSEGVAVIILASKPYRLESICDRIININPIQLTKDPSIREELPSSKSRSLISWVPTFIKNYGFAFLLFIAYLFLEVKIINFADVLILTRQISILGFAVVGVYFTTLCDGFNFSVGSQAALTAVLVVFLAVKLNLPLGLIVLLTFIFSMVLSMLYSVITIKTGIPIMLFSLG